MTKVLPTNVSVAFAARPGFAVAVLTDEHGVRREDVYGFGSNRDEALANLTERYYAEVYDHRDGSHLKGRVWVNRAGTVRVVKRDELASMVAEGWSEGNGRNGPRGPYAKTLAKLEAMTEAAKAVVQ